MELVATFAVHPKKFPVSNPPLVRIEAAFAPVANATVTAAAAKSLFRYIKIFPKVMTALISESHEILSLVNA